MMNYFALGIAAVTVLMVLSFIGYTVYSSYKHHRDIIELARAPLTLPSGEKWPQPWPLEGK